MQIQAAAFSLLIAAGAAFNLQPPANDWAKAGSTKELICKSSVPITSCSWDTPYDKNYPLGPGLKAEAGRLEYVDSGNEKKECGIRIKGVNATDDGVWACNVGVVDEGEVSSAKGQSRLNIAQKPKSVKLMDPYDADFVNITSQGARDIKCVVEDAMPEPFFSWTIDQDLLENADTSTKQDGQTWIQTLSYTPTVDHHNRSLTCKTSHVGFEDGDETEASVVIVLNTDQDLLPAESSADYDDAMNLVQTIAMVLGIGIAILLFFASPVIFRRIKSKLNKGSAADKPDDQEGGGQEKEDSEATVEAGEKDEEKVNLTADEPSKDVVDDDKATTTEEEAAAPAPKDPVPSLGEKIASFFRMRRDSSKVDDVETAVTTDENSTENANEEKKAEEEEKKSEKEEEKTEGAKENATEDKAEEAKKEGGNTNGGGFSIWNFFKRSKAKKTEEEEEKGDEEKAELTAEEGGEKEKAAVEEEGEKKESDEKKAAEETEDKEPIVDETAEKTDETEKEEEEEEKPSEEQQPKTPTPEEEPKTTSPRHTPV